MEEQDHDLLIEINANVKSLLERLSPLEADVGKLKIDNATHAEMLRTHCDEIDRLRATTSTHNWINSIAILLGSLLGISLK